MENEIKVSVIIPAFNSASHIKRSINSVLNQTFKPFEIIVVDDGSTDETSEAIKSFGGRVIYLYKENGGEGSARNYGIENAKCEWIAFLDSDDEWTPRHLEFFLGVILQKPELMWFGAPVRHINEKSKQVTFTYKIKRNRVFIDKLFFSDYLMALPPVGHFSSSTMVINAKVFENVGKFDNSKKTGTDRDMWFRIGLLYPEIGYCGEIGANIYKRDDSLSHSGIWDPDKTILGLIDNEELAKALGKKHLIRAQARIIYRVKGFLRKAIYYKDISTLAKIKSLYFNKLPFKYKLSLKLFIAFPCLISILKRIKLVSLTGFL